MYSWPAADPEETEVMTECVSCFMNTYMHILAYINDNWPNINPPTIHSYSFTAYKTEKWTNIKADFFFLSIAVQ